MSSEQGRPSVLVLLSGGIDSAAVIAFYREAAWYVSTLFVDYGQEPVAEERVAAAAIARHYHLDLGELCLGVKKPAVVGTEFPGRNAAFVLTALLSTADRVDSIALGIHGGTAYWDCSAEFVGVMQHVLDAYTQGRVQLGAPFLAWQKGRIMDYARSQGVPLDLAYSCLRANGPCGVCESCRDVRDATRS